MYDMVCKTHIPGKITFYHFENNEICTVLIVRVSVNERKYLMIPIVESQ